MHSPPDPPSANSADPGQPSRFPDDAPFGPLNWALFAVAVALLAIGYTLLALAGRNAADAFGRLAPFLIVGGLIVFGLGFLPGRRPGAGASEKQEDKNNS